MSDREEKAKGFITKVYVAMLLLIALFSVAIGANLGAFVAGLLTFKAYRVWKGEEG